MKKLSFLLILAFFANSQLWASAAAGRVTTVHGTASILRQSETQWFQINSGTSVVPGDRLILHPNSHARVELQEGSWVEAGPQSDLIFQKLSNEGMELMLLLGSVLVQSSPVATQVILTASAAVHVEGNSRCLISSDEFSQTAVKVDEGRVRTVYNGSTMVLQGGDTFIGGGRRSEARFSGETPPSVPAAGSQVISGPASVGGSLSRRTFSQTSFTGTSRISTFGVFAWPFGAFWLPVLGHPHHFGKFHPKRPPVGGIAVSCDPRFHSPDARTRILGSGVGRSFSNAVSSAPLRAPASVLQQTDQGRSILRSNPNGSSRFDLTRQGIRESFSNYRSNRMRRPSR